MGSEFIIQRIVVGAVLVLGVTFVAWLCKFLLFPVVLLILAGFLFFIVGDLAIYFINNFEAIKNEFKKAIGLGAQQ